MSTRLAVPALGLAVLAPLLGGAAAPGGTPAPIDLAPDSARYHALWDAGVRYDAFFRSAEGRRALWERNTASAEVPDELRERALAVPGRWRLLVVAFDRCSDSVNTLPYLAALADEVPALELRIVGPDAGREVMEAHRTPDGRVATPTVVVLDPGWNAAGSWTERPSELQRWFLANPEGLTHDQRYLRKMAWYAEDAGRSTIREVVELLEAAGQRGP